MVKNVRENLKKKKWLPWEAIFQLSRAPQARLKLGLLATPGGEASTQYTDAEQGKH